MKKLLVALLVVMIVVPLFAGCAKTTQTTTTTLKVAALYATPIEEPWDGAIHQALLKAKSDLNVQYDWVENVGYADFERVLRDYATKGYNVIFGDGFGSEDVVRRVAKDFPTIDFVFGMGGGAMDPNLSVFDDWIHEPAYLCGIIAGKMTKTNNIGIVCAIPDPEVNRIVNAFIEGAKSVNSKVYAQVSFIGSWFDPTKAKEMALAQISKGADVMFGERYGVVDACKEKSVYVFGNILDQNSLAPDYVITGPIWNMYPTVEYVIKSVQNKSFVAQDLREWSMMAKGGAELAPFYGFETKLPKEVVDMVTEKEQQIKSGEFRVPINEAPPVSG